MFHPAATVLCFRGACTLNFISTAQTPSLQLWTDSSCCCPRWVEWALGSPVPPASLRRTRRPAYLLFKKTPALLGIPGQEAEKALSWRKREQRVEKHSTAQLQVCWEQHRMTLGHLLVTHGRTFSWCQHSPDNLVEKKSQGFQSHSGWQWWRLFAFPLSEDKHEVFVFLACFFLLYLTLPFCEGQKPDARNGMIQSLGEDGISHTEYVWHIVTFCTCCWTETVRNGETLGYLIHYSQSLYFSPNFQKKVSGQNPGRKTALCSRTKICL